MGRDSGREYRREMGRGIGRDGQTKHFPNFQPKGRPEAKFSSVGSSGILKFIMVADFNLKKKKKSMIFNNIRRSQKSH